MIPPNLSLQSTSLSIGLRFSEKSRIFNADPNSPTDPAITAADPSACILGVPVSPEFIPKRVTELTNDLLASLPNHDAITVLAGGYYAKFQYDLKTGSKKTVDAICTMVESAAQKAGVPLAAISIHPRQVSDILRTQMAISLLIRHPDEAWPLFLANNDDWFRHASSLLAAYGYTLDFPNRILRAPGNAIFTSVDNAVLSKTLASVRKAHDIRERRAGHIAPSENAISQLLAASGRRPTMEDPTLAVAASLLTQHDDSAELCEYIESNTCHACQKPINAHHPLRCPATANKGHTHDTIIYAIHRELKRNDTLCPRANKKLNYLRHTSTDFRPDIEVDGLMVEVKTSNYDTHGPRLRAEQQRVSIKATAKYVAKVGRKPLIIAASTNGRLTNESHATLKALSKLRDDGMPQPGTRMILIVGLAIAQAASSCYDQWFDVVTNLQHLQKKNLP